MTFYLGDFIMSKKIFQILKKQFDKGLKKNEVPVGAVITDGDKILVAAHNTRHSKKIISGHAELLALNKLYKKNKYKNFRGMTLYVTLEPCKMCVGAIEQTGLNKVVYFLINYKNGAINQMEKRIKFICIENEYSVYFREKLTKFFKELR